MSFASIMGLRMLDGLLGSRGTLKRKRTHMLANRKAARKPFESARACNNEVAKAKQYTRRIHTLIVYAARIAANLVAFGPDLFAGTDRRGQQCRLLPRRLKHTTTSRRCRFQTNCWWSGMPCARRQRTGELNQAHPQHTTAPFVRQATSHYWECPSCNRYYGSSNNASQILIPGTRRFAKFWQ
eukprot:9497263-Pyramimonas_sp.AAC.1